MLLTEYNYYLISYLISLFCLLQIFPSSFFYILLCRWDHPVVENLLVFDYCNGLWDAWARKVKYNMVEIKFIYSILSSCDACYESQSFGSVLLYIIIIFKNFLIFYCPQLNFMLGWDKWAFTRLLCRHKLLGLMDNDTREWTDGVLTGTFYWSFIEKFVSHSLKILSLMHWKFCSFCSRALISFRLWGPISNCCASCFPPSHEGTYGSSVVDHQRWRCGSRVDRVAQLGFRSSSIFYYISAFLTYYSARCSTTTTCSPCPTASESSSTRFLVI